MKKIDIFNHIQPKRYFEKVQDVAGGAKDMGKRTRELGMLHNLDGRFRLMDEFGDYTQILTIPGPQLAILTDAETSPELARIGNDGLAELVADYPDRFAGFAAILPLNNPDAAVEEANRAIDDLGAKGVEVFTNIAGKPLDAPEFEPLWQVMEEHDLPV